MTGNGSSRSRAPVLTVAALSAFPVPLYYISPP